MNVSISVSVEEIKNIDKSSLGDLVPNNDKRVLCDILQGFQEKVCLFHNSAGKLSRIL